MQGLSQGETWLKHSPEDALFISLNTSKVLINYEADFVSLLKEPDFYGRCVCIRFSQPVNRMFQIRLWDNLTHQRLSHTFESIKDRIR